jgi:hypothetical protein
MSRIDPDRRVMLREVVIAELCKSLGGRTYRLTVG